MARAIRISERTARWLLEMYERAPASNNRVSQELRAALQPKKRVVAHAKRTRQKKRTKRDETSAIYEKVAARASNWCESCGGWFDQEWNPKQMDHYWGRSKAPQSVRNCWMLCRLCHEEKTLNIPSADLWLRKFVVHCDGHGYTSEAAKARRKLESLDLVEQAAKVSGGET